MAKNLVIVESPAKAKTLSGFLGSDYQVKSSYGHIRDLPKKELGVDLKKDFEPTYGVSADKQKVVKELKTAAKDRTVWLASDSDREGEAIAWHVAHVLGLDPANTKRIVFHEITKPAVTEAIANPRTIDMKLVDAQQARRVLDRLVGYELSPVLWKKVRQGLSAGRVQSVAVRLIVERERQIKDFKPESAFKVTAVFSAGKEELQAELSQRIPNPTDAKSFLEHLTSADFTVSAVDQKPGTRSPGAPFTTSTLQQEAAHRLGYSVRQTMTLAQKLYEQGHITYMRTDSTNLSGLAIAAAKTYVTQEFGQKYHQVRQYKTKSRNAQEAHEANRPTHLDVKTAGADGGQQKLYELIWRRTLASQMAPATVEKTEVKIDISGRDEQFLASGEVLVFDGFLKVYGGGKDDLILPPLQQGQKLSLTSANALENFSRPPARYGEAGLVRKLEELGIGRPSTYAPTISTIQDRGYIEKKDLEGELRQLKEITLSDGKINEGSQEVRTGADRAKLVPTPLADIVIDFLIKYFGEIVDYDFTAKAEADFDEIADGKLDWRKMLEQFYKGFHPLVEKSEKASRAEAAQSRLLGKDPRSGQPVYARYGRFGPVLQMGELPAKDQKDAPKPRFAPLPTGAELDAVTLDQALPMFALPREVGTTTDGDTITADIGRFGPYVKVGKEFYSIKDLDPFTITEQQAREAIKAKKEAAAQRVITDFGAIQILNGPYGPYVTDGKRNARVPKATDPKTIDQKTAQKMLDEAPAKKGGFRRRSSRRTAK